MFIKNTHQNENNVQMKAKCQYTLVAGKVRRVKQA